MMSAAGGVGAVNARSQDDKNIPVSHNAPRLLDVPDDKCQCNECFCHLAFIPVSEVPRRSGEVRDQSRSWSEFRFKSKSDTFPTRVQTEYLRKPRARVFLATFPGTARAEKDRVNYKSAPQLTSDESDVLPSFFPPHPSLPLSLRYSSMLPFILPHFLPLKSPPPPPPPPLPPLQWDPTLAATVARRPRAV